MVFLLELSDSDTADQSLLANPDCTQYVYYFIAVTLTEENGQNYLGAISK